MIIGIDPGMHGAIAVRYKNGHVTIYDIPTCKDADGKSDIDLNRLRLTLKTIHDGLPAGEPVTVVCEKSMGMSFHADQFRGERHDDSKTAWKIGYNFGIIKAFFSLYLLPFTVTPRPSDWKRHMGLSDGNLTYDEKKNKARMRAIELFPEHQESLKRKKDADRAEALLLTVWAERRLNAR